jgi:hypothetical protein
VRPDIAPFALGVSAGLNIIGAEVLEFPQHPPGRVQGHQ